MPGTGPGRFPNSEEPTSGRGKTGASTKIPRVTSVRETTLTEKRLRTQLAESRKLVAELRKAQEKCKRAELALRESEQKLGLFIENAPAAIAMMDREMRYLAVSRRWLKDYGLGERDILGRSHYEIFPEIPARWKEIHRRALAGETLRREEDPFPRLDGKVDWVRWEVLPWHESNGKIGGIIMLTEVITARKELEQELGTYREHLEGLVKQRTRELEERNRKLAREISERRRAESERQRIESRLAQAQRIEALDRFAGGIAHDLNNLLYPIIVNTEELLEEEPYPSPRREILEQILNSANRQRSLVKKVLTFSRLSEKILSPMHLAPQLEETVGFLRSTLPSTLDIRCRVEALSDVVMGDPVQFQQIVMNLVQNSADALSSRKGTIEVSLKETHLDPESAPQGIRAGDYLELAVRDNGPGMRPDVQEHIFEPFYTTKEVGRGTGLGLPVVHGIVKDLGGAITVESAEGKGTLFNVYIPEYPGEIIDRTSSDHHAPSVPGKEKILLIDDEEIILASLKRALNISGYRVVAVKDSMEALRMFGTHPSEFDLVITDLTMPKMTGIELAGKVLGIRPDIPVILSTGFNDVIDDREAKSHGIRELLLKPAGAGELKATVRRALEH